MNILVSDQIRIAALYITGQLLSLAILISEVSTRFILRVMYAYATKQRTSDMAVDIVVDAEMVGFLHRKPDGRFSDDAASLPVLRTN